MIVQVGLIEDSQGASERLLEYWVVYVFGKTSHVGLVIGPLLTDVIFPPDLPKDLLERKSYRLIRRSL